MIGGMTDHHISLERCEVRVLPHAIKKARERWGLVGSDSEVAADVENRVRQWVERRQVFTRKPRQFRPYGHDGFILPWQRLVGGADTACIIALDQIGKAVVVTVLSRVEKIHGAPPRGRRQVRS